MDTDTLKKYGLSPKRVIYNDDGSYDYDGSIYLHNSNLRGLDLNINTIHGDLIINNNNISTFDGFPKIVDGMLDCRNNSIKSLIGIPTSNLYYFSGNYFLNSFDGIEIDIKEKIISIPSQLSWGQYEDYCERTRRNLKFKKILKL